MYYTSSGSIVKKLRAQLQGSWRSGNLDEKSDENLVTRSENLIFLVKINKHHNGSLIKEPSSFGQTVSFNAAGELLWR